MPYRPTELTESRRAQARVRIVRAAHELIARGGYREASVAAVARRAGVATGSVYRHFPSKAELFAEVFRTASQREVDAVAGAAAAAPAAAPARIAAAVEAFAERALAGRRLAWALLAEPVDPAVEAERLEFRRGYRDVLAQTMQQGIARGELAPHDTQTFSAALIGATAEALIGPLSTQPRPADDEALIASLVSFCAGALPRQELAVS
jgi:AcrR family transcriptional regulator